MGISARFLELKTRLRRETWRSSCTRIHLHKCTPLLTAVLASAFQKPVLPSLSSLRDGCTGLIVSFSATVSWPVSLLFQAPSSLSDAFFLDNRDLNAGLPTAAFLLQPWLWLLRLCPTPFSDLAPPQPPHRSSALPMLSFPRPSRTRWAPSPPHVLLPCWTFWRSPPGSLLLIAKRSSNRPPLGKLSQPLFPSPSSWVRWRVLCTTALTPWLPSILILNHAIVLLYLPGSLPHWPVSS